MPRITLPSVVGGLFDSWDPTTSGMARVYWLGTSLPALDAGSLVDKLAGCETLVHVVAATSPESPDAHASWLLDRAGELGRAFGTTEPIAILVDAAGRVVALLAKPTPEAVAVLAMKLYQATRPVVVEAKAPVLLLERVIESDLCLTLIEYWQRNEKLRNTVGSNTGNVVNADVKRRQDVQLDDAKLFVEVRDRLVRRVVPAMAQAFHARVNVIEAPLVGCYDAAVGGWFLRHRDNTSRHNAHRQFALTLNLNDDYDGGEVRFPEFGRELYRAVAGGAVVFSCSLLHEVAPVTRGRRFGLFTFLSASGPSVAAAPAQRR